MISLKNWKNLRHSSEKHGELKIISHFDMIDLKLAGRLLHRSRLKTAGFLLYEKNIRLHDKSTLQGFVPLQSRTLALADPT